MTTPAISVRGLSKCYRLGSINRHTLVEEVEHWWHKLRGRDPRKEMGRIGPGSATEQRRIEVEASGEDRFWALRDISFDIRRGEIVGIIGRNGAGKSTLLKILSRITEPTEGEAIIEGRVGSLLEVGTGFHPELTGRENVYLNGAILGMRRTEVSAKLDDIVGFAEVEKFIDTPVKRYSSGMYVRLAFAVAANLEAEIVLVDEVLAVGDVAFQTKCLGKMKTVAGAGRTVLFVSHNMLAIRNLCSRAIVIDEGRVTADTDAGAGVATYLGRSLVEGAVATEQEIGARLEGTMKRSEIPYLRITEIRLADQNGVAKASFASTEPVTVCVSFECLQTARDVRIVVAAADEDGVPIYGSQNTDDCGVADHFYVLSPGRYAATCQFPPNVFGNKKYYLNVQMLYPKKQHLVLTKILGFRVRFDGYNPAIQYAGNDWGWPIWPKLPWGLNRIAAP